MKHLVELHGGRVRAHSDGIDQGATFIVELPLMAHTSRSSDGREHPTARRLETAIGPSALAGMRVLRVDDEADTLELFTRLFTQHGAHVTVARNAEEAIGQLGVAAPDVLVCDIEMPGEDGYSLLRKVRSQGPREGSDVPAVAVTAYGSVDDRIRLLAAGFQMHVPKPVEPAELVTVVASVAGRMLKP